MLEFMLEKIIKHKTDEKKKQFLSSAIKKDT